MSFRGTAATSVTFLSPAALRMVSPPGTGTATSPSTPRVGPVPRRLRTGSSTGPPARRDHDITEDRDIYLLFYTSAIALSIKSGEADRLARELAAETGETLTEAIGVALRERLEREHDRRTARTRFRLMRLAAEVAAMPVADPRTPEEILGYDDTGLPR